MEAMDKVFGRKLELLCKDGSKETIPTAATVVGLFFASSNVETQDCAARVAEVCSKTNAVGKVLYVIYISLDADDATACAMMPEQFVALPQADGTNLQKRIWADLELKASPSLVLYQGATGQVITANGMRIIREDPDGLKFPWTPQSLHDLLGEVLIDRSGRQMSRRDVLAGKIVGLLFVAQWSAPSLRLLETLRGTFASIRQRRADVELVLVSADKTAQEHSATLALMQDTWYAKPYTASSYTDVTALFNVHTIPTLVVIDCVNSEIITYNGHHEIAKDPYGSEFPWFPRPPSVLDEWISKCVVT